MLQGEHSALLSNFIKPPFLIKIFILSIFEWLLKTGFTVQKPHNVFQCRMGALAALSVMVDGTKTLLSAAEERLVIF